MGHGGSTFYAKDAGGFDLTVKTSGTTGCSYLQPKRQSSSISLPFTKSPNRVFFVEFCWKEEGQDIIQRVVVNGCLAHKSVELDSLLVYLDTCEREGLIPSTIPDSDIDIWTALSRTGLIVIPPTEHLTALPFRIAKLVDSLRSDPIIISKLQAEYPADIPPVRIKRPAATPEWDLFWDHVRDRRKSILSTDVERSTLQEEADDQAQHIMSNGAITVMMDLPLPPLEVQWESLDRAESRTKKD
ncbi:hypothetical protein P7C73_g3913, partial [Tremellales sp. Uapishka_1]